MNNGDLSQKGGSLKGRLLQHEKLAKYTSWHVGGVADQLYFPFDRDDLVNFISALSVDEPVFFMGMGSNLLIRDGGIRGTVVNTRGRLKTITICDDQSLYVEVGVHCSKVARFCRDHGFIGAEFFSGIPGTMGGALKMNAGAFGCETWDIVEGIEAITTQGETVMHETEDYKIGYRSVIGPDNEWFLAARLRLAKGSTKESAEKTKELLSKRSATQPLSQPSCGSVFKNPNNDYAARLIEVCGLKGYVVGGACVSEQHANFIINQDNATAKDIETLIEIIQVQVEKKLGVMLEREVEIIGEFHVGSDHGGCR
ncbi:MAG: UDP-N-acetylmuramate dehydrogenase [Methylococcales bacterium]|nr:UDP-N-acetylmuramate dehydrogenase [Methylococcales bacterium]MBT3506475.1 UDP-N-acetylmuramate dehydrogenase [Methylococcales bacterium]MBT4348222.1 UDP-N-acetylmuramate dehydrogenase [Methylococcales bacterium]MDP7562338.1 UDP-N-acetylmuramate dehydrogenase [Methylococcales bacterium]